MVVKLQFPPEVLARVDALAPLARRATLVRRLVEIGLERVEARPEELRPPRPATNKVRN